MSLVLRKLFLASVSSLLSSAGYKTLHCYASCLVQGIYRCLLLCKHTHPSSAHLESLQSRRSLRHQEWASSLVGALFPSLGQVVHVLGLDELIAAASSGLAQVLAFVVCLCDPSHSMSLTAIPTWTVK